MESHKFAEVLASVGPLGRFQVYIIILTGVAYISVGSHNVANVFLAGLPSYLCISTSNMNNNNISANQSNLNYFNTLKDSACYEASGLNDTTLIKCSKWKYDRKVFKSTIATEWNLVCENEWKLALSQSLFMLGFLIGAMVFGNLSDIIGRKISYCVALFVTTISASITVFMPNYWSFVSMRVVNGAGACGIATIGFVIIMEILGIEYRTNVGIFYQAWFSVGVIILSIVAYFINDYKYIQLYLGLSTIIYVPYWCLLNESPRWLLTQNQHDKAVKILQKVAYCNRKVVPTCLTNDKRLLVKNEKIEVKKYSVFDLFKTTNMMRKTLITWFNWFVVSMIYYGLSMGVGNLAGGPYLNLFLSGIIEFPGFILSSWALERVGRKLPCAGLHITSGLACIAMGCTPSKYGIAIVCFSLIGKMTVAGNFAVVYVYSAELFPTVTRSIGVGSGSMCARVGSLLSPFIALLSARWKPLPSLIFGTLALCAGVFVLLLPETLNQPLPETMEDGEAFGRNTYEEICQLRKLFHREHTVDNSTKNS